MQYVNLREARQRLAQLVTAVERGEEVVIERNGRAVARLVRPAATGESQDAGPNRATSKAVRQPGRLSGLVRVMPGCFDPLSDEEAKPYYGEA